MSEETPDRLSVTLKAGTGYDAPWVVARGNNATEVNATLDALGDADTLRKTAVLADAFHKVYAEVKQGAPQPPPNAPQNLQQSIPVQSPQPPDWGQQQAAQQGVPQAKAPFCPVCGQPRQYKSGKGEKGLWQGWFCSSGERSHPVEWVK